MLMLMQCKSIYARLTPRVLHKIGAWFALDVPYAQKSFWTHPTVPLGDVDQVEAHFGPFGDSANFDSR